ncbi:hypothetical protein JB92DRAFT_2844413 [Gautieria morchelliformis]|nr:hypothetical protein JB92DRAFT_2844413 [Gautieria morchelliformis]
MRQDCRDVEDRVQKTFQGSSETGLIIYVGQKPEWKSSTNKYRNSHNIESIPTIVRINNGIEEARLVGDEISRPGTLEQFIRD